MTEAEPPVLLEMRGEVAWATLNRPTKRNALNPATNAAMHIALDKIEEDSRCRAVVLRGAGGNFSAGMDMREFLVEPSRQGRLSAQRARDQAHGWWHRLRWLRQPSVAMVEGVCMGGAFAPLFACDIAIAAENAKFALPEIDLGLLAVANITKIVGELMGQRKAAFYLLTGQPFDGSCAEAYGLITEAVPNAGLEARVSEITLQLAAKDPLAIQAMKEALKHVLELSYAESEDYLDIRQLALSNLQNSSPAIKVAALLDARKRKAPGGE